MNKTIYPNIVRGGIAIPLDRRNYYYILGRSHEDKVNPITKEIEKGKGVHIGNDSKTGLEVEDGEIVKMENGGVKVYSAVPMLAGKSPAERVLMGEDPNKVFAAQETFKKVNGLKDDGTKAQLGKQKTIVNMDNNPLVKMFRGTNNKPNNLIKTKQSNSKFAGLKTHDGRGYNSDYIDYIYDSLSKSNLNKMQQAVILSHIINESGGDPFALNKNSGKDYGLLQWVDRYTKTKETDPYKEIDNQLNYIYSTVNNLDDKVSWTHGGEGSGYQSLNDAYSDFSSEDLSAVNKGFSLGYVRPAGKHDSANNRFGLAEQIYDRIKRFGGESDEDKYIKQKADSISKAALIKSRTRELPSVPYIYDSRYKDRLLFLRDEVEAAKNNTIGIPYNPFDVDWAKEYNRRVKDYEDALKHPNMCKGSSCIYTATDNYGKQYKISGNQTFRKNPEKYGFKKINIDNVQPSDLIQVIDEYDTPIHAMIFNGKDENGTLKFNYSRGGAEKEDIVINGSYPMISLDDLEAYRFVGTKQDSINWKNEYHKLNKKQLGGNMKHKLIEVNIGGNSKLIRVPSHHSTGESERSEGRDKAELGANYGKFEPINLKHIPITTPVAKINTPVTNIPPAPIPTISKSGIWGDIIGAGSNIIGSLITRGINNKMIDNLKAPTMPVLETARKLNTKYNINSQEEAIKENLAAYERQVAGNTGSSRIALARINRGRNLATSQLVNLYGQKENIETQLRNQDAMNQQTVAARNIERINRHLTDVNNFNNKVTEMRADNNVSTVQNINQGVQDLLARRDGRTSFNKTLMAQTFANPNLPAELFYAAGIWDKNTYDMYRKQYAKKS